jgi:hypothetical protein
LTEERAARMSTASGEQSWPGLLMDWMYSDGLSGNRAAWGGLLDEVVLLCVPSPGKISSASSHQSVMETGSVVSGSGDKRSWIMPGESKHEGRGPSISAKKVSVASAPIKRPSG